MPTKQETLDKQIAAVQDYMQKLFYNPHIRFSDGRVGHSLVLKKVMDHRTGNGWTSWDCYEFYTNPNWTLKPEPRQWLEANGMKKLADQFDRVQLERYVDESTQSLRRQREKAVIELAELDAMIKRYDDMLPPDEEQP